MMRLGIDHQFHFFVGVPGTFWLLTIFYYEGVVYPWRAIGRANEDSLPPNASGWHNKYPIRISVHLLSQWPKRG
jgi:hypothetical protein